MNSHLVIPVVRPVGVYFSMCELDPLLDKSVSWVATVRLIAVIVSRKRNYGVGFYRFPAFPEDRRRKGSRQSRKKGGLHQNIREYAVVALLHVYVTLLAPVQYVL